MYHVFEFITIWILKRQYIIFDGDIYFSIYFKLFAEMNKKVSIQNFPDYFISKQLKFKSIKYNV